MNEKAPNVSGTLRVPSVLAFALALLILPGCGGCQGSKAKSAAATSRHADSIAQYSTELFNAAIDNLNHLEDNDCMELVRTISDRIRTIASERAVSRRVATDSLLASWPEPQMLGDAVGRLNEWAKTQEKPVDWKLDPLVAALPPNLAKLPMVRSLDRLEFTSYDGFMLMEAVWLRDLSNWARGKTSDELTQARNLFDWTVRNIQLDPTLADDIAHIPQFPWETLFLGHGTAEERAWTYILLLRQQGIDAAMLGLPMREGKDGAGQGRGGSPTVVPWCAAVSIGEGDKKQLYLFDPHLGLPIPASKSTGPNPLPATLEQVVADPHLLDRLDVDADQPYWAKKGDLKHVAVMVEASPLYVSQRGRVMESRMAGPQKVVLGTNPTVQGERIKAAAGSLTKTAEIRLWTLPYTTLERRLDLEPELVCRRLRSFLRFFVMPTLYKGRILHIKGRFFAESEAVALYQQSRPSENELGERHNEIYKHWYALIRESILRSGEPPSRKVDETAIVNATAQTEIMMLALREAKYDASYWLGLVQYEGGDRETYRSAADYFTARTLRALPGGPWTHGAHYNLGRCYEALDQPSEALEEYQAAGDPGSRVRVAWLKGPNAAESKKPENKVPENKVPEKNVPEKNVPEKKGIDNATGQKQVEAVKGQ